MTCLTGNMVSERKINLDVTKTKFNKYSKMQILSAFLVNWHFYYVHSANMKTFLCTICKQGN